MTDAAAVAADSLLTRIIGEYDLTGPEALGYREVCRQFSATLDHEVKYTAPSLSRFLVHRLRTDHRLSKFLVMAGVYTPARLGLSDRVTGDVSQLLGREPTALRSFIGDYRGVWE
jgi:hypothetical protein